MKLRVTKPTSNTDAYAAWGNQAPIAKQQGWFPETSLNGQTVYRSNYSPAFNNIVLPNQPNQKGHIALIGSNNKKFDVVIRDNNGNIQSTIFKGITPDEVQKYITSQNSLVSTRAEMIKNNTVPIDVAAK